MKKTTIQKLIEELKYRTKEDKNVDADQLIYNLGILLEDEKEMLIEAYNNGLINGYNYTATGKEYYKRNFEENTTEKNQNGYDHLQSFGRGRSKY